MSEFSFTKKERLKSQKAISKLFETGRSLFSYPVKFLYIIEKLPDDNYCPVKCGFSVSKRNFRLAVDRNLLKRRMREAYRLNKNKLMIKTRGQRISLNLFIIYVSKEKEDFFKIQQGITRGLNHINDEIGSYL